MANWIWRCFFFKVLVHHPEDFPLVRDRGFVIGAGQEVFVGVDGSDVYSTLDAKTVEPIKRKCYFHQERALDYYANYTRSNCLLECSFKFIKSVCQCVPYFYPSMYFITVASHAMFAKIIIVSLLNHIGNRKDDVCLRPCTARCLASRSAVILPCLTQRVEHFVVFQVLYSAHSGGVGGFPQNMSILY